MLRPAKIPIAVPALAALAAVLLCTAEAHALAYFNTPSGFGFDNGGLHLSPDYEIVPSAPGYVHSGVTDPLLTDLGLLSEDTVIADTSTSIDRTITWTLINNAPQTLTDLLIVFTGLGANAADYPTANVDIDVDGFDPMVIASLEIAEQVYWLAGYRLTSEDFGEDQTATRTFRYTVDVGQVGSRPPDLGIMYMTEFTVPEPATGLLLGSALLLIAGTGRRHGP
jgi:hypothetical protein